MDSRARFRGCLLGLAAGDAVGTTVEFRPRASFEPLVDMVGGGPFGLEVGQWTDDTSMALCLAASLIEREGFDPQNQMQRYGRWSEQGYMSSTGSCFDIGTTVAAALRKFARTGEPFAGLTDPRSAGNGSLMRLAPVPMFCYPDLAAAERWAAESSRTTHGAAECVDACRLFSRMIVRALSGAPKHEVLLGDSDGFAAQERIAAIARGEYRSKGRDEIAGSGYVVASLEAALWCFHATSTFEAAILAAANLGDDADTTAAVCGQVAGAHYGIAGIPDHWVAQLAMGSTIDQLAVQLHEYRTRV